MNEGHDGDPDQTGKQKTIPIYMIGSIVMGALSQSCTLTNDNSVKMSSQLKHFGQKPEATTEIPSNQVGQVPSTVRKARN